jgi:hypothetical protein
MVPPVKVSDHPVTHRYWYSRWTKWPSQCTDALHRHPIGPSSAEEHPLGVVLCSSNTGVRWTAEMIMKCRFIRCWSNSFGTSLYDLNVSVRWTVESTVGSSGAEAVEIQSILLPNPKGIGWTAAYNVGSSDGHFWIPWSLNSSSASRNASVGSSDTMLWISTRPIQTSLSFSSILLLLLCFHDHFEPINIQGPWVCIFSWLLVHGQATSARTPLNSTVKHYKLAIQVSFIFLWHFGTNKVLSLVVFFHLSSINSNWGVSFYSILMTITQDIFLYKTKVSHKHVVVIYHWNTLLPKVWKGLDSYKQAA